MFRTNKTDNSNSAFTILVGFFYRLFAFRKMKQYKEDAGDGLVEINRNVQPAPMR